MDKETRINLDVLNLEVITNNLSSQKPKSKYDFETQLKKLKREELDRLKCPYCKHQFLQSEAVYQDLPEQQQLIEHCPSCNGVTRIFRKNS